MIDDLWTGKKIKYQQCENMEQNHPVYVCDIQKLAIYINQVTIKGQNRLKFEC